MPAASLCHASNAEVCAEFHWFLILMSKMNGYQLREREIRRVVRVVFRGTSRFGKKTVSLRSSHNAYLEGAWRTNRPEVVNSTMETNKASNLRRMPLKVLLINLLGDGVNLALRWYISVSPKLCLTLLSKTWHKGKGKIKCQKNAWIR